MSRTQSSNERVVLDVIERFRECQNLIPAVVNHLRAMESITRQCFCIEGASRRHPSAPLPPSLGLFGKCKEMEKHFEGCSRGSNSDKWIPAAIPPAIACTPPLGVLQAFPPAVVEHLVGDHQRNLEKLLKAISDILQVWQRKVSACRQGLDKIDFKSSQSPKVPGEMGFDVEMGGSGGEMDSCAAKRGLGSSAQLGVGVYGLLAALVKMESVLQEGVLALRQDFHRCRGNSFASFLLQLIERESEEERGSVIRVAPSTHDVDLGTVNLRMAAFRYGLNDSPYRLVEALEKLGELVQKVWERCKRVYCTEESFILLASGN